MICLTVILLATTSVQDPKFSESDLKKLVARVEAVAEQFDLYVYPPEIKLTDDRDNRFNAYAGISSRDGALQTVVAFDISLVKVLGYDEGKISAVLCHEFAHLAKGHSYVQLIQEATGTVRTRLEAKAYTREQEEEADVVGLKYLLQIGYSRDDMMDVFRIFDEWDLEDRESGYRLIHIMTAGHPSAMERMATVAEDPSVWESLLSFRTGVALMEYGEWASAIRQFNRAIRQEEGLEEAYVNRAICALRLYYDSLSYDVRASWPIPEFYGLVWLDPSRIASRGEGIDAADRSRYRQATGYVSAGLEKFPENRELLGMSVQVLTLHPDEVPLDEFAVSNNKLRDLWDLPGKGMTWADKQIYDTALMSYYDRSGLSNDEAEGYRADLLKHYRTMMDEVMDDAEMKKDETYAKIGFLVRQAPNIAGLVRSLDSAPNWKEGVILMRVWLSTNPASAVWDKTNVQYRRLCVSSGEPASPIPPAAPEMQEAISVSVSGGRVTLLDSADDVADVLGEPASTLAVDPGRPGLTRLFWSGSGRSTALLVDGKVFAFATTSTGASVTVRLSADLSANAPTLTFEIGKTFEDALKGAGGSLTMVDLRFEMQDLGVGDEQDLLLTHKIVFRNGLIIVRSASDGAILSLSIGS